MNKTQVRHTALICGGEAESAACWFKSDILLSVLLQPRPGCLLFLQMKKQSWLQAHTVSKACRAATVGFSKL